MRIAMLARILPNPPAAVACIPHDPVRAVFRAPGPMRLICPPAISLREDRRLVLLPGCSHQGEQTDRFPLHEGALWC